MGKKKSVSDTTTQKAWPFCQQSQSMREHTCVAACGHDALWIKLITLFLFRLFFRFQLQTSRCQYHTHTHTHGLPTYRHHACRCYSRSAKVTQLFSTFGNLSVRFKRGRVAVPNAPGLLPTFTSKLPERFSFLTPVFLPWLSFSS